MRSLCVIACLVSTAAADPVRAPTCSEPKDNAPAPRTITEVDWCNFDFRLWKGALRAGRSELHLYRDLGKPHDTFLTSLRGVVYGDLDGDGTREAAVVIEQTNWIAGRSDALQHTTVYVYAFDKRAPRLLGSIGTGTPVHDIAFAKSVVTVTSGDPKEAVRYRRDAKTGRFVVVPAR